MGAWRMNQAATPVDAEDRALEHELHRKEELVRIEKTLSRWRLFRLVLLMIPIAFASPLYILYPGLFWKIVAMQIDRSGPCFIKLAQWLSTRRDIFSDELCECLSIMHESVEAAWSPGMSSEDILVKLKNSDVSFNRLYDIAIASGSIAEVYFGELCDGTQVAVKCLRPNVRELLEGDLAWMLHIGNVLTNSPKFAFLGLRRAAEEFCEHVQMQVDFEIEAGNLRRFRSNFANSGELVRFPTPLYASKELLVLTREKGDNLAYIFRAADVVASKRLKARLRAAILPPQFRAPSGALWPGAATPEASHQDKKSPFCTEDEMTMLQARSADIQEALEVPARTTRKISAEILACYMRMVFNDAFIHGDLHPGNMMVELKEGAYDDDAGNTARSSQEQADREVHVGGWKTQVLRMLPERIRRLIVDDVPPFELVMLDAGLAIPIGPKRVEALRSMAISMLYCDFKGSATHIFDQSPDSSKCIDPEAFKEDLANVFRRVRALKCEAGYMQVSDACLECLRLVRHHQVQLDTGLSWALFAMLSAEGSARQLDPEADCTGAAARYIVTVPSLFREMGNQSPEILWKMIQELIYGRRTHQNNAGVAGPMRSSNA